MFHLFRLLNPTGKERKLNLMKADLVALVMEKELANEETALSMSKPDLLQLLGGSVSQPALVPVKLASGVKLFPQAFTVHNDKLLLYDGPTTSVWELDIDKVNGKVVAEAKLLLNLPSVKKVAAITSLGDYLWVASQHHSEGGLYKVKLSDGTALECLWRNESGRVISGLCSSEEKIYFSDQGKSQIHCLDTDSSSIKLLSGKAVESEKLTSQDGLAINASHAQCGPLTMMGKTLVVGDMASVSLRLVSDMKCLLSYHKTIDQLCEAFSVHSGTRGYRQKLSSHSLLGKLDSVCSMYNKLLQEVRDICGNQTLKPNGPHGSLPHVTISMFHDLKAQMTELYSLVATTSPEYVINPNALLSLPCEHHFSTMRQRYPMPTILQYCQQLHTVVQESVKRMTVSSYHYFTHKASFYPQPKLQEVIIPRRHLSLRSAATKKQKLQEKDRKLMQNWRLDYCAGLRNKFYR